MPTGQALTLAEYAGMSNEPLAQKVIFSLLENAQIWNWIPIKTDSSLKQVVARYRGDGLPSNTWSALNAGTTKTSGAPERIEESAYIMRNTIQVDNALIGDTANQIVDPRVAQLLAYLKYVAYDSNDKFINNDPITGNQDAPTGLRWRLDNPTYYKLESEMKIDAGALDLTKSNMTSATARSLVEYLNTMLEYLGNDTGEGTILLMSGALKHRIANAISLLGAGAGWNTITDAYGRTFDRFRGAIVLNIGRKADQTTQIITSTETSAGAAGSSTYTSIYGVRPSIEDGFGAWQQAPFKVQDLGPISGDGSTQNLFIEWIMGWFQSHSRAISRMYGIKVN